MAYDVTSQWDDIHRRLGNYEELPVEKKQAEFSKEAIEAMEKYDPLAEKNLDELDEMEDDLDEEFLKKYKEQRLQEMQGDKEKPKFSGVREITKQDYVDEVTNAPKGTYVIIHLYQTYIEACGVMNQVFDELAPKYPQLKFVRIVATKCIENYPDINCPNHHHLSERRHGDHSSKNRQEILKDYGSCYGELPAKHRYFAKEGHQGKRDGPELQKYAYYLTLDFTGGAKGGDRDNSNDEDDEEGDGRGFSSNKLTFKYV
jgi:thiol-disulfide isomerase/thioredoxin